MGIFDLFKKKQNSATFPENELDRCLMQFNSGAASKKEFYQKLLWNQLYLMTNEQTASGQITASPEGGESVEFVVFENGHIPVFTSVNRIFDKGIIKQKVPVVGLKGMNLFGIAKGSTFVLNPYSDYAKVLNPDEIEQLMNGTIYDQIDQNEAETLKNQAFNKLFERAGSTLRGLVYLDGYQRKSLSASDKLSLEKSIEDFKKCLTMVPDHWQSMVLMAKALQRLERHSEALEQLEAAFVIEPQNPSIPMEASLEAMHLKDIDKALFYSNASLNTKPHDASLLGNHAMNLLVAGKDSEALSTIEKAMRLEPNDTINKNIESIIRDVLAGKRARPTFEDTLK